MNTSTSSRPPHILLAGGGSGGHIFPALAVGEELVNRGVRVSFAGSPSGMEAEIVPARGLQFFPLAASAWVGRGLGQRLRTLGTLAGSTIAARGLVRREKVDLTLGTGGYVSVPAALGTRLARRPIVVLEPNAVAGTANRLVARFARGACVAPAARPELACELWETGVPVRSSFLGGPVPLPATGPIRLLILGGSLGSHELNVATPQAVMEADRLGAVEVLHQSGRGHGAEVVSLWAKAGHRAQVVEFVEDVAQALRTCHLVISRAGAITLAEIAAIGRGAVLVPLAAAGNHQGHNARERERLGAAVVVEGGTGLAQRLAAALQHLLADRAALEALALSASALARPDAAAFIADRLLATVAVWGER